jgi:molybdenum cofactor cytidylyltransferase
VVVGYRALDLMPLLTDMGIRSVVNEHYDEGMLSSVRAGVATLDSACRAFLLLPVDIPLVRPATVQDLLQASEGLGSLIYYPTFLGKRGHPPMISSSLVPAILAWQGEGGLRALLRQHDSEASDVPVADEYTLMDADTPADYRKLVVGWANYDIPSPEECMALLQGKSSDHQGLMAHSKKVAQVAAQLARELNRMGQNLDLRLTLAASLLHDLCRGEPDHGGAAAKVLTKLGYEPVAAIVGTHMSLLLHEGGPLTVADIVCFADKVVQGDQIVALETRFVRTLERHAQEPMACEAIRNRFTNALRFQVHLERILGRSLENILAQEWNSSDEAFPIDLPAEAR